MNNYHFFCKFLKWINFILLKELNFRMKFLNEVMDCVCLRLKNMFGYEVVELNNSHNIGTFAHEEDGEERKIQWLKFFFAVPQFETFWTVEEISTYSLIFTLWRAKTSASFLGAIFFHLTSKPSINVLTHIR